MRRRDFIKVIAASAVALPPAARAQQPERMRRIGVLMFLAEDDLSSKARLAAFIEGLHHMAVVSAFDPKRTSASVQRVPRL
jgi:putative ABC transport system substrate-binding protein